jgi:hypothetical protein
MDTTESKIETISFDTQISDFSDKLEKTRTFWLEKVKSMSASLLNMSKLAECQVELYSYRQICIEYQFNVLNAIVKLNKSYKRKRLERWKYYKTEHQMRMDKDITELHIDVDIENLSQQHSLLSNQLDFAKETVKTIDNLIYGIKHRISIEDYKRTM